MQYAFSDDGASVRVLCFQDYNRLEHPIASILIPAKDVVSLGDCSIFYRM